MQQFVLFVFALILYPVLFIGMVVWMSALYKWLRACSCLSVASPCRARLITIAVAVVAVILMAPGVPNALTSVWHWLALAAYGAGMYAGIRWLYERRESIKSWVRTTFELE